MYDILIKHGRIVDGTGNPWFRADIGISEGRIVDVDDLSSESADRVIDVDGRVVCPGFVDIHSHTDFTIFRNPKSLSKVVQGITTEVIGNCGLSLAPVNPSNLDYTRQYVEGFLIAGRPDWSWTRMGEYIERIEDTGIGVNLAPLFGHGTIRTAVMGFDERAPSDTELKKMKQMVEEAMEDGAVGMSSGLIYPPGCYAETEELIELSKVVARYGGIYTSHIRGEGDLVIQSVEEAIRIGEEAGLPVQISHLKVFGKKNWGRSFRMLQLIDEARERGVDVTGDQYPYPAGSSLLTQIIPPWAVEGGVQKMIERLKDSEVRKKIRRDIETKMDWENLIGGIGFENILVTYCKNKKNKIFEGKNLLEISRILNKDPFDAAFDLLVDDDAGTHMVDFYACDEDMIAVMKHPAVMICSDMWAFEAADPEKEGRPHPRAYGAFPRILARYVRDEKILRLEEAIRKMTSASAHKVGARDRGLIREGVWADILVFDPIKILDRATFQNPHQTPEGIEYVLVNGVVTVDRGRHTGALAGKVLRRRAV